MGCESNRSDVGDEGSRDSAPGGTLEGISVSREYSMAAEFLFITYPDPLEKLDNRLDLGIIEVVR